MTGCALINFSELVFGDAPAVGVGFTRDGEIAIDGRPFFAHNSGAGTLGFEPGQRCLDYEFSDKWAVWRRAAP
jgi:hypothetical protein